MKKVFIIHGWDGYPEEGWFPWLKKKLKNRGLEVVIPQMPDADTPRIGKWIPVLKKVVGQPDNNTYFIGHSIGVQAILRYLEQLPEGIQVGGAVFVAGFLKRLSNLEDDEHVRSVVNEWLCTKIDFNKIKTHLNKSVAIFSDNDPYVPLDNQDDFRDKLNSDIQVLSKRGHFSGSSDQCFQVPEVLTTLIKMGL